MSDFRYDELLFFKARTKTEIIENEYLMSNTNLDYTQRNKELSALIRKLDRLINESLGVHLGETE